MEAEASGCLTLRQHHVPVDKEKVGDVYLVRFQRSTCHVKSDFLPLPVEATATHHALMVDLLGLSDAHTVSGLIMHLTTDADGHSNAQWYVHHQPRQAASVLDVVYLGHLEGYAPRLLRSKMIETLEEGLSKITIIRSNV